MKLPSVALVAAVLIPAVPAAQFVNLYNVSEPTNQGFIIELNPGSSLGKRDVHWEFHIRARELVDYSVRHEFKNPEYFYGLSVDAADVSALMALPEVKNIWPNRVHDRPRPFGASAVAPGDEAFSLPGDLKRDDVSVPHITGDSDVNSALKLTSVDEVHKLNITGKGVKVGIIDSGIDYRHPALGGGFGPGFKVAGGYDLVGDNYSGTNTPVPDDDPLTVCLEGGHGSHVAGILAARDPEGVGFGIVGVAPDAELHMYRVFGCVGSVTDEVLMQALQMAVEDGVDVISISIGYAAIWEAGSPYDTLLAGIRNKGVGLVIAAGNDGERGLYFTSEPSLGPSVIAVGAVSNTKFATLYDAADSTGETIEYARIVPFDGETPFNVFTTPNEESACDPATWLNITQQFADKEHVIGLISPTSHCSWWMSNLAAKSGITHIFWTADDDEDFRLDAPGDQVGVDVVRLRNAAAEKIRAGIEAQGSNYTLTFSSKSVHDAEQPTNGTVNFFSTFGPTMEMSMKPQLAAPGGNILNTWPITNGTGYALISGTSMAAPHVAGVYALIKQAHPDLSPEQIAHRMQATSNPLVQLQTDSILTSTSQQGSGLVNALKAITYETVVSPTELNLRDSASPPSQKITIENRSSSPRTYKLGHRGAASVDALPLLYSDNLNDVWRWVANNNPVYASASFSSDSVEIPASSTTTFEVTVTPSTEYDPAKLPVYGGYITITSDEEEMVVPYAGVPYTRSSLEVLDTTNLTTRSSLPASPAPPAGVPELPYVRNSDTGKRINDITTFTFPSPGRGGIEDNPVFVGSIRQPCSYVRFDVVPADTAFEPTSYGYDASIKHDTASPPVDGLDDFAGVKSYGGFYNIVGGHDKPVTPWQWYWRGYGSFRQEWQWATVALDNGTIYQLANADYRVLIRALRFDYDWKDPKGYDSWLSPVIRVNITDPGYPNPLLKKS